MLSALVQEHKPLFQQNALRHIGLTFNLFYGPKLFRAIFLTCVSFSLTDKDVNLTENQLVI